GSEVCGRQEQPSRNVRFLQGNLLFLLGKQPVLNGGGRACRPICFISMANHEIAQELRWRRILLASSLVRVNRERVLGARHGDVEEAALFLQVRRLFVTGRRIRSADFRRESNQRLLTGIWEGWRRSAQDSHMREFQPFGG